MLKYILLGLIQGLTEFFPVSSSGHLVILGKLLGITGNEVALTVVLHLGTVLALLVFFFKDIFKMLRDIKSLSLIIVVTIVTGIIGITGKNFFEGLFASPKLVALALIFTGIILLLTKKFMYAKSEVLDIKDALILGLAQGFAIIPGISRSGITISTLLFRKVDRKTSFRFSFLASIPAILGAAILKAKDIGLLPSADLKNFIWGFFFSFITGIFSLWLLKRIIEKAKLYYFGYYCIFIALITLLFIR